MVYDGVVGPWFLGTFLGAAGLKHLHYAVLLPPLEVCLERVTYRQNHGFTDRDAAEHMWDDFHRADLDPRHIMDAPENLPAELARTLVRRVENEAFRHP